jgi:pre-mRNA-splicing factor SYF1
VIANPYSVTQWFRYFENSSSTYESLCLDYESALTYLPRSYKLWRTYLKLRTSKILYHSAKNDSAAKEVISSFERAIHFLNKMPRLW